MPPMAPTRPTSPAIPVRPHVCRVRLAAGLAAARTARAVVETAIRAWRVPVDSDVAVLLTSELVTNAVTHGAAETASAAGAGGCVTLAIVCSAAGLRVDVHDGSGDLPLLEDPLTEAETGRGLLLVTSLSAEWGFYPTAQGKAVYFTLGFLPDGHGTASDGPDESFPTSVS